MNREYTHIRHTFEPVFDGHSRVLILGTLPSVKSREQNFYYGHQQNRFWRVLAALFAEERIPGSIEEKTEFLLRNRIALWDVIAECDIVGSSDSSIRNVIPADLNRILAAAPVEEIFANGGKAWELYMKYDFPALQRPCSRLPSTSPANAAFRMERLLAAWSVIRRPCPGSGRFSM